MITTHALRRSCAYSTALIAIAALPLFAQRPADMRRAFADSSVAWIMSKAKTSTGDIGLYVLRQVHQAYPLTKRNELADSIVGRRVSSREIADSWLMDLSMSGSPDGAGTPFPTALEHLMYIARHALNSANRADALVLIPRQANPGRAVRFLRELIVEPNGPMALPAVNGLVEIAFGSRTKGTADGASAQDELRRLAAQGVKSIAQMRLCEIAASQHWPRLKACEGRA